MKPSRLSLCFLLSFVGAIFLLQFDQTVSLSPLLWILLAVTLIALTTACVRRRNGFLLCALACIIGITVATASVWRITRPLPPSHVANLATGQILTLTGTITEEPDRRATLSSYVVSVDKVHMGTGAELDVHGKVLVRLGAGKMPLRFGDRISANGKLQPPWNMSDFRMDRSLARRWIYAILTGADVTRLGEKKGNVFLGTLLSLKERFEGRIERLFPEPHASFLEGLLTGSRRGIPKELTVDFNTTGLTHIIAISGYNITIVLTALGALLFWIPLKLRFLPSILALIAFTLFTGASASVVRAAIMGGIGLFAVEVGRLPQVRMTILQAAFLMLLWQPMYLWHDGGFQLSFLAVIGIVEGNALMERMLRFIPFEGIRESLQTTLAAQLLTIPWIMLLFGRLSLIAPVANLLVAPLIPLTMLLGFLGVTLSFLILPLGQLISYGAWGTLELIIFIVRTLAQVPFASLDTKWAGVPAVLTLYVVVILFLLKDKRRPSRELTTHREALSSSCAPTVSSPPGPAALSGR
ncbi:MAG: ComEC/Rec2 family competence protein [Candidatus Peribacteraceae bacterium]